MLFAGFLSALVLLSPLAVDAAGLPAANVQTINVPLFLQRSSLWSQQPLGTCADTLGSAGCTVTAVAMVYAKYGVAFDSAVGYGMSPDILNAYLSAHMLYNTEPGNGDCLLAWWRLPAGVVYTGSDTLFAHLDRELAAGHPVIAQVHNAQTTMHFVVITGSVDNTYRINDPYYGVRLLDDGKADAYTVDLFRYLAPTPVNAATTAYRVALAGFFNQYDSAGAAGQTATRLADGRVLLTTGAPGGPAIVVSGSAVGPAGAAATAATPTTGVADSGGSILTQIYDPANGQTRSTGGLLDPTMRSPVATALSNGQVLFTAAGAQAELYDPVSETFRLTGTRLCPNCVDYSVTPLADGRVLFAGGYDAGSNNPAPNEIYDPASGQFSLTGALIWPRLFGNTALLPDGRVLVTGGLALEPAEAGLVSPLVPGSPTALTSLPAAEIYDPATGQFSLTGSLVSPRALASSGVLANGQVSLSGGYDATGTAVTTDEIFNPASGTFIKAPPNPTSGNPSVL